MSSASVAIAHGSKTSWPEVVGKPVDEAKAIIHRDRPDVKIVVIPDGTKVTGDFDPERVRVFVSIVTKPPKAEETSLEDNVDTENIVVPIGVETVVRVPHIG